MGFVRVRVLRKARARALELDWVRIRPNNVCLGAGCFMFISMHHAAASNCLCLSGPMWRLYARSH